MTISSTSRKAGPYTGNDVTTSFPFSFKVFVAGDVTVIRTDPALLETTLTTGFSVTLNADQDAAPGGSVVMVAPLATGYLLTLTSDVDALQSLDLTNAGGFYPKTINSALDRLTILVQQVIEQVGRAVKVGISSSSTPDELIATISAAATSSAAAAVTATDAADAAIAAAATLAPVDEQIHAATAKSPLVAADEFGFWDSVSSALRKITWANILATILGTANLWTKAQRGAVTALTDAATVAIDASLSNNFSLLTTSGVGATRKLGNPTNLVAGQSGIIAVTTDAVSRLLTFDTYYKFSSGTAPTMTATSGAVDYFSYYAETTTRVFISQVKDVK